MKLFFWCIHPYNVIHVLPECSLLILMREKWHRTFLRLFFSKNYRIVRGLLNDLRCHGAVWFMDLPNLSLNRSLWQIAFSSDYMPIPLQTPVSVIPVSPLPSGEVRIGILGRLSPDKIYSVINVLDNFLVYSTDRKRVCHIIGDGDARSLIDCAKYVPHIDLRFHSSLLDDNLDHFLINKVDVLFAMGTSCLAGAALGLPVIQMDYGFAPYTTDLFHFLYDAEGVSLGKHYKQKGALDRPFPELLDSIATTENKQAIGKKCKAYFLKNHEMNAVVNKIIEKGLAGGIEAQVYLRARLARGKLKKRNKIIHKFARLFLKRSA